MEVFIDTFGTTHCLDVQHNDTEQDLKKRLQEVSGDIVWSDIDLYFDDQLLQGVLSQTEIYNGCCIKADLTKKAKCRAELLAMEVIVSKDTLVTAIRSNDVTLTSLLLEVLPGPLDIGELAVSSRYTVSKAIGEVFLAKYPVVRDSVWSFMNHQPPGFFELMVDHHPPYPTFFENNVKCLPEENACILIRKGYPKSGLVGGVPIVTFLAQQRPSSFMAAYLQLRPSAVHFKTATGQTALHLATINGNKGIVQHLLSHGADPNAQDNDGDAPLHEACCVDFPDVTRALLRKGADPLVKNAAGLTPYDIAVRSKHTRKDTLEMLRSHIPN
eukprot:TRINITY_DN3099_c0_g1_i1.p1 TRINITY_DN3099_c0_g1~~TRINITY_DN3099_c0_g1_i1.p1  ORF type:complete len:328 (+),score=65.50 TRINITY_DN3099_c0_g1_i1:269-1252(+)